tara:strand:+ start:2660 stop:2926 length:267 start_codon:yes stop_codon:yes gene_type:complete
MPAEDGWHLSKSVPATLIFGLFTQAAAIVWTVSMMMSDIDRNSNNIASVNDRLGEVESMVQGQAISLAVISENIKAIRQSVEKMSSRP